MSEADIPRWPNKMPGDVRPMSLGRWKAHLEMAADETITDESWTVTPAGSLTLGAHSYDAATDRTIVVVSGGTMAEDYRCTCRVVTDKGQEAFRSVDIYVGQR